MHDSADSSAETRAVLSSSRRLRSPDQVRASEVLLRLRLGLLLADVLAVHGGLYVALAWNLGREPLPYAPLLIAVTLPLQILVFSWRGSYAVDAGTTLATGIRTVIEGLSLLAVGFMAFLYLGAAASQTPRLAVLVWLVGSALAVMLIRLVGWAAVNRHRSGLARSVILVGDPARCVTIEAQLLAGGGNGTVPVAMVLPPDRSEVEGLAAHVDLPLVPLAELGGYAVRQRVDRVMICASVGDEVLIEQVMDHLKLYPVEVCLVPDLTRLPLFCLRVDQEGSTPVINLSASPMRSQDLLLKRIEDLVLSSLILAVISPFMLLIAGLIKLTSPGPVLFAQKRHGYLGQTIRVLKFRTMTWIPVAPPVGEGSTDSGTFLQPRTGTHFRQTVAGDARVIPIGRFLRRFSLDELPQFLNVLAGDMSIVGPRPHARSHNLGYVDQVPYLMRRHYVKPGITGLAQIQGARGRTEGPDAMRRRVALDLEYIRRWSLWLDLRIIVSTMLGGFYTDEP